MTIKKNLLIALISLGGLTTANAEEAYLSIDLKSGETYSLLLAESPIISYNDSCLLISGSTRLAFPLDEVDNYHFTNNPTTAPVLQKNEIRISYLDNQTAMVEGLQPNTNVILYSVNGAMITQASASVNGNAKITLPQTAGVYILKTNHVSLKLVKK